MAKKKESYEEIMEKLEEIILRMEKGDLSLDDSIKHYEEGMKSCNKLYKMLNEAEGKIKILNNGAEIDFENEEQV
ncbi:exodeoxyribonuclease VII small subunit [Clostridium thermarum]|uniref:exodeoxyribonuclease VII small subunit n=1 Tax=Clostridium thermarum TaxID=1716543 RepID=UPI00111FEA19|nr:exodeoxyribonuclease VII small subunit [Clostridium thermarum]